MDRQLREPVKIEIGNSECLGCTDDDERLEIDWRAAKFFLAKGPSATLQYLKDEPKALMFALEAQALDGSPPVTLDLSLVTDPALRRKQEAWRNLNGMPRREAKKRFVDLLTTLLPEWKEWYRTHVLKLPADASKDEVGKILSDFSKRTGLVLKSKL